MSTETRNSRPPESVAGSASFCHYRRAAQFERAKLCVTQLVEAGLGLAVPPQSGISLLYDLIG